MIVSGSGRHMLVACVGSRLTRSFIECDGGGVVWVWLNIDMDSSGGGKGEGSIMKGKRKILKAFMLSAPAHF
jgi:hypothetical protein